MQHFKNMLDTSLSNVIKVIYVGPYNT